MDIITDTRRLDLGQVCRFTKRRSSYLIYSHQVLRTWKQRILKVFPFRSGPKSVLVQMNVSLDQGMKWEDRRGIMGRARGLFTVSNLRDSKTRSSETPRKSWTRQLPPGILALVYYELYGSSFTKWTIPIQGTINYRVSFYRSGRTKIFQSGYPPQNGQPEEDGVNKRKFKLYDNLTYSTVKLVTFLRSQVNGARNTVDGSGRCG
ncbi:uncharacterized protein LOC107266707 [Cephus cinctus]|uniref:Uncharacterized protein LOC107266707 n=1 Tax=Cephus cinctus TaxID=211228 RepID=A0AAJ7RG02_CEPCN|nr:uncharacterized protein LOC107266707 [Cephus cinctus]